MTQPDENVTPAADEEIVATPATPGAEGLPLPEDAVDKPSES